MEDFRLVNKADDRVDLTDALFERKELIHLSKLEFVRVLAKFCRIAKPLQENELLVSSLGHNSLLNKLDYDWQFVVHRRKFKFLARERLLIHNLGAGGVLEVFALVGLGKGLADRGLLLDVFLDQLEDRHVEHVELDCKVCT